MMRTTRSYYEILGLPMTATAEQIKDKYRQLVRKFHPDVAPNKETAHQFFILINEAYDTLTNPLLRREYDAKLLEGYRYQPSTGHTTPRTETSHQPRRSHADQSGRYLREAQRLFILRRFKEASSLCREALQSNPRSAQARAMLGDIYKIQGRFEHAISEYTRALQYDPTDVETEIKLARLLSSEIVHGPSNPTSVSQVTRSMVLRMAGWTIAFLAILIIPLHSGTPIMRLAKTPFAGFSVSLVAHMMLASFIIGIMLAVNGLVDHPERELYAETLHKRKIRNWLNTALLVISPAGFTLCAAVYLIAGYLTDNLTRSVTSMIIATCGVAALAAMFYNVPNAPRLHVALLGGNFCFWAMLAGVYTAPIFQRGQERNSRR